MTLRSSAVSWVQCDGLVLCVWNQRFQGWAMPGGMVEPGETVQDAQVRELREETGLLTTAARLVYRTKLKLPPPKDDRSSYVHLFQVQTVGVASEREPGCPVAWFTWEKLCAESPFGSLYRAAQFAVKLGLVDLRLDG